MREQLQIECEPRPTNRTPTIVQCQGYRCAAYQDEAGRWRNFWNGDLLPEPVRTVRLEKAD
jgi:hypothetical protein